LAYLTRDTSAAEELTQETFAAAWAAITGYKGRASPGTWLHKIAHGKFVDWKRRLRRQAALTAALKQGPGTGRETSQPLSRLIAQEHLRLLFQAMDQLGDDEYMVILLHYIEGLSFRQVAKVLDVPVGTAKWQSSRALGKLRQYLVRRI
jgi:RNA polymerase sigma-70 factor (ECF subfamily)